ncbi:TetR family transcriptional regulator [Galbitalea sp. SE-J8]|uniref:TetR/AcrR family transcriptional regulator n=1 Tax=Galbitalea sp. SE-J8 TaxID=3054952 RepID=UPI00259CA33A|nr:TetR family transcriptional regulator [Galbitalea sp. SE-J8]MDM4763004.1 TetR family transcriptional regulator [Galbitalea sp. SE-J8]
MTTRADAAARTADRIADAMLQRFAQLPYDRIRLEDIATDAEVTVQTVIRRFGSKPELLVAVVTRELGRIVAARESAAAANATPAEVVAALSEHYERYGALILRTYAVAGQVEGLPEIVARGRAYHVDWCRRAFEEHLEHDTDAARAERRLAQVVAVCDARTWYILRIDCGLGPEPTATSIAELLSPLLRTAAA